MGVLAVDFGGTLTRAAWFNSVRSNRAEGFKPVQRVQMDSRVWEGQETTMARMIALARSVIPEGEQPESIGISAPGPLDTKRGIIHHAKTLPEWGIVPIAQIFEEAFGCPVIVQNDANLAAVAEYHLGAGQGANPMIYLTVSTGIGGGVIIDGQLFTGWRGMAAEPGHQQFVLPDGRVKRLEELASGTGIGMLARERLARDAQPSSLRDLEAITGKAVGEAAQNGDALACAVIAEAGRWLGLGIVNLLHLFNPQAVVMGGGVSALGDLIFDPVRATIQEHILDPAFYPDDLLRPAALGFDVCLHGAALYAVYEAATRSVTRSEK